MRTVVLTITARDSPLDALVHRWWNCGDNSTLADSSAVPKPAVRAFKH